MAVDQRDRIAGALYGLLVGDAFGCPVEGWAAARIHQTYGRLTEMEEPKGRWRPRGLHSDDGQQALAIGDAVLEAPHHPGPGFARRIVELLQQGPARASFGLHRGTGGNFRQTAQALANGSPWDAAASMTAGNGAAMRIAPVALYHRDDDDALAAAVIDVSRVTHHDIRGLAAAGAVAWLVARALRLTRPARTLASVDLVAFVRALEGRSATILGEPAHLHDFSQGLERLVAAVDHPRAGVFALIESLARQGTSRSTGLTDGFVMGSVMTAIYQFLISDDYEQTLIETVALGGDADTTGALVGQMCGARYGEAAIPMRWREALLAYGALGDRIDALLARQAPFAPAISLVELERPWTELYVDGRQSE